MGKKRFGGKQGLNKRQRTPEKFRGANGRQATKKGRTDEIVPSPSPSSQEELSDVEIPEPVVNREPSMYDNLLTKLGSKSKSLAHEYKRRQRREEGNSDTEEDEDDNDGSDSIGESEEEDEEDERKLQEHITVGDGELIEGAESEDESEASTDIEQDSDANAQTADESPACSSSFNVHLGHTLSDAELENLSKKKWKYEWEVPAANMPNCKWMGTGECFLKDLAIDSDHGLKLRLYKPWLDVFKKSGGNDSEQRLFFSLCDSYRDILHCNKKSFYLKGREEDSSIMDAYIMHSLNHIFRTRDLVMTNKTKLNHQENAEKLIVGDEFLDQGFTRPKVLILLPFKSIAKRVIERLIQLTRPAHQGNVDNRDRFNKEYGTEVVEDDDLNGVQNGDMGNFKPHKTSKPADFQALFSGNTDDHFMIGIKFTRKSIQLYNDFYKADMIVASPLNLITKIGHSEVDKEKDVDYLSSIEVLIIDHADVIAMQNWDHVKTVVQQLNQIPSKQHGTDIMRIRPWYLDGRARFYRQTIVLGSYLNPDMNALFNHHCTSYSGKVKSVCQYKGVLPKVLLQVRQIYERFNPESIVDEDDARLEYFTKKVFPKIKDSLQGGVMLFTSSYFEYVRVRNFLKSQNASFCLLGEYTKQKDISRARVWFFEGTRKIMLYTERAHFYHRYKIRGIQNLIIYSLPERKEIYPEIVNMLEGSHNMSCTVLFSRFDQLRLERIVGTAPAKRMVTSDKAVFVFC